MESGVTLGSFAGKLGWREVAEGCEIRWPTGLEFRLNSQSGYLVNSHKTGNLLSFVLPFGIRAGRP